MDARQWRDEQRRIRDAPRAGKPATRPRRDAGIAPLASVVVVCWNAEEVVGRCVTQLLAQEHPSFEVVVVDDGSDDATVRVAEEAAAGSGMVRIVRSAENRGCPHARNLGVEHAAGDIVAFIDSDGFATPSWLSRLAAELDDPSVGGVASTVFMDANPLVLNGAGGIVNRQGWAADLCMSEPLQQAELATEVLYPMGCGMAFRRSALERVGPFDDQMLNYYDDVDYGIRVWRAGFRIVLAKDAWIDHGFGHGAAAASSRKQLLCEQHRMRVVLKHAALRDLPRWAANETLALRRAAPPRRRVKRRAIAWNMRRFSDTLGARRRLRRLPRAPRRLLDPSWGEGFPSGVPALVDPAPENAKDGIDMTDPSSARLLPYGWFPVERANGRSLRWATTHACALVRLEAPAELLRLEFSHAPVDLGGVDVEIRGLGAAAALAPAWSTHLRWHQLDPIVENHPVALDPGDYEVAFRSRGGAWVPPRDTRRLAFALARMSFEPHRKLPPGGLDMAAPNVERQLVSGWYIPEAGEDRAYRWASRRAELMVRLSAQAQSAELAYRLPPGPIGGVTLTARPVDDPRCVASARIDWHDDAWHVESLPFALDPGDYVVCFEADEAWSNEDGRDPAFGAENRALAIAISAIGFR
ncbi:MAG: glycosyltransferase family 2 protein [Solirubrobacteraceae bacterium]